MLIKSTRDIRVSSTVLLLVLVVGITIPLVDTASATNSISKIQSGIVTSDSLVTGDTTNWTFGGTATSHNYYEDSQGLHLGIKAPQSGQWVNYYALYSTLQPNANLFHAVVTIPDTIVPDGVSNIGLYVEGSDFIPHVGCEAYADSTGYYWIVEQSRDAGETYTILYITQPSSMPQTQDCTIITNGSNYLKVYISGNVVFSSNTMDLGMSTPLHTYVQDDTSSPSSMHYATYSDYYTTTSENIKVTNNPSNAATVKVVDSSGQILSSSSVTSGIATLNVGKYSFPLSATINVYDSSGGVIVSSPSNIYGGDVFSVTSSSSAPQPPTGLVATVNSSSQINLSWTAPNDDGGSAITGYKIERSTNNGNTWSTIVSNTGSTGTTYSDAELASNTGYTYRVSAINSMGTSSPSSTASATTLVQVHSVILSQSGLVVSDSLTNETQTKAQLLANQQFWNYGGSATVNNTPYDISRDPQGFHIGVQSYNNGNWTGFYGVAPSSNAVLFHAVVTTPVQSIPTSNDFYENGLYVQTASQNVNYVTCFADTGTAGTVWAVVSATGDTGGATNFNLLWYDSSPNQPLTRDCTIITNGSNYLKVYLDGSMVYTSNTLNLQMPGPFIAFLEPQTSYPGQMLYGTYKDYYSTTNETLKVTNNPSNAARADVLDASGTVLASSPVSAGTATLSIGQYHYPMAATIKVYDSGNNVIASTSSMVNIFGGDVYLYN